MRETNYLSLTDAHRLITTLELGPVLDEGLLDSALARPRAKSVGTDAYPDLATKAAALFQSLAKNPTLATGNGLLTWSATFVFVHMNGHTPSLSDDDGVGLVVDAAGGSLGLSEIAQRLALRPLGGDGVGGHDG